MADAGQQPPGPNMVQCEITKQWVPADEIIEIQGHKVCSAGKEILLQRLKSGEALPGEMERPTVLRRFLCIFLDNIILGIPIATFEFAAGIFAGFGRPIAASSVSPVTLGVVSIISTALTTVYFGTLHGLKGQTVGKMAGKIRVVNLDGRPITISHAFWRALLYESPTIFTPVTLFLGFPLGTAILMWAGGIYFIVNVVMALVDRSMQRALHDRLAGTRVVMVS